MDPVHQLLINLLAPISLRLYVLALMLTKAAVHTYIEVSRHFGSLITVVEDV